MSKSCFFGGCRWLLSKRLAQPVSIVFAAESREPAKLGVTQFLIKTERLKAQRIQKNVLTSPAPSLKLCRAHQLGGNATLAMSLIDPEKCDVQIAPIGPPR